MGQAADILDMTPGTLRRWRLRMERWGTKGLLGRRRDRPTHRKASLEETTRILALYRDRYAGFNVRHFHALARREHGVKLSYTFVKMALQAAGLARKYRPRGRHRRRREPRARFGELLHLDGNPHAWLALAPGQRQTVIQVVDDATKRLLYGRIVESESTATVMMALRAVMEKYGLPGALYNDRAGWAVFTPQAGGAYDSRRLTQVGRALEELGIEHILAYSPQARGRSERVNRTLQHRLINELRQAEISTVEAANDCFERLFIPRYNTSFAAAPRDPEPAFVPLGRLDLDPILCSAEERVVGRDNTVVPDNVRMQLDKQAGRRSCAGLRVVVHRHLDGTHTVWRGPRRLGKFKSDGTTLRTRPVEVAGPVDAGKRVHKDLGRLLNPAGVHSSHKAAATTIDCKG